MTAITTAPTHAPKPCALVTGAGRTEGLGFETCRQLAVRGFDVFLTARRAEAAEALAARLAAEGHAVRPLALDVTSASSVDAAAAAVRATTGRLDVLVNNAAGVAPWGERPSTADLAGAAAIMDATLFGAWRLTQRLLPLLVASPAPRIVMVTSGAGSHGDPVFGLESGNAMGPSYAVAKAALNALTSALARELRDTPVIVNAVCPGFTATFPGGEGMGARPVAEGAAGIVWAATLPDDGPRGGFFRDARPLPW
jgi:NAD(P)-dependent dehydrogenase (short-subunit alcohol dehydrogenase family)